MQHTHSHSHPHPAHPDHAPLDDDDASSSSPRTEAHHQATTSATFDSYKRHALAQNQHRRAQYYALSKQHRDLVPGYNDLLRQVRPLLSLSPFDGSPDPLELGLTRSTTNSPSTPSSSSA